MASLLKSNKLKNVRKSTLCPNLFSSEIDKSGGNSYPILLIKLTNSLICTQPEQSLSIMLNTFKNNNDYTGYSMEDIFLYSSCTSTWESLPVSSLSKDLYRLLASRGGRSRPTSFNKVMYWF